MVMMFGLFELVKQQFLFLFPSFSCFFLLFSEGTKKVLCRLEKKKNPFYRKVKLKTNTFFNLSFFNLSDIT